MQRDGAQDWSSDASVAYALLRLTMGVNIGFRGLVRIMHGTGGFAAGLLKQFEATPLSAGLVSPYAHALPYVETVLGVLLILGLWTRPVLVLSALMMTSLTFGTMFTENFTNAWLQLTYAGFFFLLLALRSWNLISLDGMMGGNDR